MVQKTKEEVQQAFTYYKNIVNTVREALVILDEELKVVSANDAFYSTFHISKEETEHRPIYELGDGQWNADGLKGILREIIPKNEQFQDYIVDHEFPVIGHKTMLLNGRRIKHEEVSAEFILLAIEDITERKKVEEALKKSENTLAMAQRIGHIASWEWNIQTGEVNWSAELYSFYGADPKTFTPTIQKFADFVHPDDREYVNRMIEQILSTGKPVSFDFRIVSTNGSMHVIHAVGRVTEFDENGKPRTMIGINQDVTERKKIEEELAAAKQNAEKRAEEAEQGEKILDVLIQYAPIELQIIDKNQRILRDSRFSEKLTGHPIEEIEGISLKERNEREPFFHPDGVTPARFDELPVVRVLETGKAVINEEWKVKTAKGTFVDVAINIGPIKDSKGNITGAVTTWHDITDIKKTEGTLRRNEYELKSVVENSPDIYFRLNRQRQYVFVNPTYERLTGLTKEQFLGKTNDQLGMNRQMAQFWQSAVQEAFESGKEHTAEFEMSGFFGKRYFSARVIPEFEKTGLVETVLVVARDIAEKKHLEEEIASIKK